MGPTMLWHSPRHSPRARCDGQTQRKGVAEAAPAGLGLHLISMLVQGAGRCCRMERAPLTHTHAVRCVLGRVAPTHAVHLAPLALTVMPWQGRHTRFHGSFPAVHVAGAAEQVDGWPKGRARVWLEVHAQMGGHMRSRQTAAAPRVVAAVACRHGAARPQCPAGWLQAHRQGDSRLTAHT